jgi:hypothetical protein
VEPVRDQEPVDRLGRIRQRPPHHARADPVVAQDAPQRPRPERRRRVGLVAHDPEPHEDVREAVVRQDVDRPRVAPEVPPGADRRRTSSLAPTADHPAAWRCHPRRRRHMAASAVPVKTRAGSGLGSRLHCGSSRRLCMPRDLHRLFCSTYMGCLACRG